MASSDQVSGMWEDYENRIEEMFCDLIDMPWGRHEPESMHPAVDIRETDDAFVITADLPEVPLEDVRVLVQRRRVTLCGERRVAEITTQGRMVITERFVGRFCRRFELPEEVEVERLAKRSEEGVLRVVLPKRDARGHHRDERSA
jgi:HSP20 family protein